MKGARPKLFLKIEDQEDVAASAGSVGGALVPLELDVSHPLFNPTMTELSHDSITPMTLQAKTFWAQSAEDMPPVRSVEEYEYQGNKVTKFTINASNIMFNDAKSELLGTPIKLAPADAKSVSDKGYQVGASKNAKLHPLEKKIIIDAIKDPAQTVLVNIFERVNGEAFKIDAATKHPLTHTIVLYKTADNGKVLVIDPSNFLFSSHLSNTEFNQALSSIKLPTIETIHKRIQIYTPDKAIGIGSAPDKYRDCSDIAVKLAFGFNVQPIKAFDEGSIKTHPVVVRISNNNLINPMEIIPEKIPARIKQTSDITFQEGFAKAQFAVDQKLKKTEAAAPLAWSAIKQGYKKIMTTETMPIITLNTLEKLAAVSDRMFDDYKALEQKFDDYIVQCIGLDPNT